LLGHKSHEIITLNKATRPQEDLNGSSKKKINMTLEHQVI